MSSNRRQRRARAADKWRQKACEVITGVLGDQPAPELKPIESTPDLPGLDIDRAPEKIRELIEIGVRGECVRQTGDINRYNSCGKRYHWSKYLPQGSTDKNITHTISRVQEDGVLTHSDYVEANDFGFVVSGPAIFRRSSALAAKLYKDDLAPAPVPIEPEPEPAPDKPLLTIHMNDARVLRAALLMLIGNAAVIGDSVGLGGHIDHALDFVDRFKAATGTYLFDRSLAPVRDIEQTVVDDTGPYEAQAKAAIDEMEDLKRQQTYGEARVA